MKHKLLVHSLRIPQVLYKKGSLFLVKFPLQTQKISSDYCAKEGSVKGGFRSRQIYE